MKYHGKRMIAALLCLVMLLGMLPTAAVALAPPLMEAVEAAKAAAEIAQAAAEAAEAEIAENKTAAEAARKAAEEAKAAAEAAEKAAAEADVTAAEKAAAEAASAAEVAKAQAAAQYAQAKAEAAMKAAEEAQAIADKAAAVAKDSEAAYRAQEAADNARKAAETAVEAAKYAAEAAAEGDVATAEAAAKVAEIQAEVAEMQMEIATLWAERVNDEVEPPSHPIIPEPQHPLEAYKLQALMQVALAIHEADTNLEEIHTDEVEKLLEDSVAAIKAAKTEREVDAALDAARKAIANICPMNGFADASAVGSWAHEGIDYAVANGLMNGTGEGIFNPKGTLTRAELVTILYRAEGSPKVEAENVFSDVENGKWYTDAIIWAAENKIVEGIGGGKFAPNDKITREQIATILYRYAGEPVAVSGLAVYPDADSVSDFAKDAMSWATLKDIITGSKIGDVIYLKPKADATREQIAAIVMRYIRNGGKTVSIYPVAVAKDLYTAFPGGEGTEFADGFKTGFGSAITFKGYDEEGNMQFYGASDRGPSLDLTDKDGNEVENTKVFPAPDFSPVIGVITLKDGKAMVEEAITLKKADGTPLKGLPLPAGETGATGEIAVDIYGNELTYDPDGFDPEGIAVDKDGNFWMGDEYGPFIGKFSPDGTLIKMYKPGDGLPEILKYRIANRGFESLTISPSGKVFAVLQSVMNIDGKTQKTATFIRILELDPETGATKMYAYPVVVSEYSSPKNCKLGDAFAIDDNTLLVVEQGKLADGSMRNVIYKVDLSKATDITGLTYDGKELEYTASAEELAKVMTYAEKKVYIDLRTIGWTAEKAEGICLTETGALAAIIEDDFGMAGAEQVEGSDTVHILPNKSDPSQIWIIE